jgi:hypothetical protein
MFPSPPALRFSGRQQIDTLRPLLDALGVHGEINSVRRIPAENRLAIAVIIPGREVSINLYLATRSATITEFDRSFGSAMVYLHKMPGQHNVALRGNWVWRRIWKWLADTTVYAVLFLWLFAFSGLLLNHSS